MTATIYQFSDYVKKSEKPKKRKVKEKNYVIFNENLECYFQQEESPSIFNWTPNLLESLRITEPQALLMIARLKWYYGDHELSVVEVSKASMKKTE